MVFQLTPIAEGKISGLIFFLIAIIYTVYYLTTKKVPYIRRVPAIDAIEEGIGRATELGKPVIASPGMSPRGIDTSTAAGLSILSHVSQLAARNDLKLIAPLGGSSESYTTMELARDIVESAWTLDEFLHHTKKSPVDASLGDRHAAGHPTCNRSLVCGSRFDHAGGRSP